MDSVPQKRCNTCKRELPASLHYFFGNSKHVDGLRDVCKECHGHRFYTAPVYPNGHKQCKTCKEIKPLKEFHKSKNVKDGYRYICKQCRAITEGFNYIPPVKDGMKRCSRCHQEFPSTNEHFFNRSGTNRLFSQCKKCTRKTCNDYNNRYPEKARSRTLNRLARRRKVNGYHTAHDIEVMLKSQNDKCWWCGDKLNGVYQIDHRIALAKGGSNWPNNLCASCPKCNRKKSDKMPWEFNGRLL